MADLYFSSVVDSDPTNTNNWFTDSSLTSPAGVTPTFGDNAYIQNGICDHNSFDCDNLYVVSGAILTLAYSGRTVASNGGSITTNNGTVSENSGTGVIGVNYNVVSVNYGTINTNNGPIDTFNEGTIDENYGSITLMAGGTLTYNRTGGLVSTFHAGTIVTNDGVVTENVSGSITSNYGMVTLNRASGTVVTNHSLGTVLANLGYITTNNGKLGVGYVGGGMGKISCNTLADLSLHTADTGVTLPSTGSSDILGSGLL